MINGFSSAAPSWQPTQIESLNQVMDSISVLSDAELQNELSIFANAEFVYDTTPGTALNEKSQFEDQKKTSNISVNNMHSLLNVKLASLAENNYHSYMSPDDINKFYDNESPDCSPPNGYYSPNPTPPNGCYSPNPTPPNGYHLNQPIKGFQGIVNPPITFYDDIAVGDDEDDFIKTMRILTSSYENKTTEATPSQPKHESSISVKTVTAQRKKRNSMSTVRTPSPLVKDIQIDSIDESDSNLDIEESGSNPKSPLSKEDKRRRNTAASARFRVKKKLREQVLQKTADEMTEKAKLFESRVHELEREVQWLKALVVEKNGDKLDQILNMQNFNSSYSSSYAMGYNTMNQHHTNL